MWGEDVEAYIEFLRASGAPRETLRVRRGQIERALTWMNKPTWDVRLEDMISYTAAHDWKPETRKSMRSALRSFFAWGELVERAPDDYARKLPKVPVPRGKPRPAPTTVFDMALAAAAPRERLMVMLAAYAGLRRAEIARAHSDHVTGDDLRIVGKGGTVRIVPLNDELMAEIAGKRGFFFPGKDDGHLSPDRVGRILADLLGPGWTGHTLRHRFATRAYSTDRDLLAVRDLLGHTSVATTERYTQVPDGALRRAIQSVA